MDNDPDNVAEPWDDGDGPGQDDGDSYVESAAPSRLGMGCSYCGSHLGDCMSPGDHCPIAKKMFAPKPVIPVEAVIPIEVARENRPDPGGVWVTYEPNGSNNDAGFAFIRTFHASELEALRVAVTEASKVRFLLWGDEL